MSIHSNFRIFLALTVTLFALNFAHSSGFQGMWTCDHPDLGGIFIRVKSDNSTTYFLEKGSDTVIHSGKGVAEGEKFLLSYENGVVIKLSKIDETLSRASVSMSAAYDVESGFVDCAATMVDRRKIGSMTIDPDEEDEEEDRSGYFGGWEGELISGEKFYIEISKDRTAGMSHSFSGFTDEHEGFTNLTGYWRKDGEKLHIYWKDGGFTVIETNGRRIEQTTFDAGDLLEEAKGYTCRIIPFRTKDLPKEWYANYRKDYVSRMPIIVLRKNGVIKTFFKGEWHVGKNLSEDSEPQMIKLGGFNKARTNRYGGVKGNWFPASDAVVVYWRNGVKENISVVGNQFVIKSYNPQQPLSGRPAKIETIDPVDPDKMGYYLNRKKELLNPRNILRSLRQ